MRVSPHIPVLCEEVISMLSPESDGIYLDATFGAGGYSESILNNSQGNVIAIDRDESVKKFVDLLQDKFPNRLSFYQGNFADMKDLLKEYGEKFLDGIVMDIGVSSMQLDQAERGFSFSHDGPLDMRMSSEGVTASDFVNEYSEEEIANVIYNYGGERKSRVIAKRIVQRREIEKIETTKQLADIVRSVVGKSGKIDPATRTFQAIRIWVNDELKQLSDALESALKLIKKGGRLVVVTFHSLEDRIVKNFFNINSGKDIGNSVSRYMPEVKKEYSEKKLNILTKKPITPSEEEIRLNIRSRSAKLRAAEIYV